jgi:O-antigen/teichoic acid export membrane protein
MALGARLSPDLAHTFLVGLAVVPVWALLRVRSSIARAFGRVALALAPDRAVREGVVLVAALGISAVSLSIMDSAVAMGTLLAGTLFGLGLITLVVRRARPAEVASAQSGESDREWLRVSLILLAVAGLQIVYRRSSVIIVGLVIDQASAGVYGAALQVAQLVAFPLTALNVLFAPTIAALHAREDHVGLQSAITTTAWWSTLAALAVAVPLFFLAPYVLALFGPEFVQGVDVLRILLIGLVLSAAAGSVVNLQTMTGNERSAAVVFGCALAVHIPLTATLCATFGLPGAAAAATGTAVMLNIAMGWLVWNRLRVLPSILGTLS